MQDLSQYTKKNHVEIQTRYVSLLIAGSVVIVGLVFALGVLTGSRQVKPLSCPEPDPLAALDLKSNEPSPPREPSRVNLSFHESLIAESDPVPTPASLTAKQRQEVAPRAESHASALPSSPSPVSVAEQSESPIPETIRQEEAGVYALQVGSFASRKEATLLVRKLKQAGHNSFVVSVQMPERGGVWYRVRVGPFQSKRDAWQYKLAFEVRERIPAFIVKRRA